MKKQFARFPIIRLVSYLLLAGFVVTVAGCGPSYRTLRKQGQQAMMEGMFGPARYFFEEAEKTRPRMLENLHDLAVCSIMMAKQRFAEMNHAAAMRELDQAIGYYNQALDIFPAHQASLEGKTVAQKLKGQFDEALKTAQWAADFVGPSARQYIFLAKELEERRDLDGALLRYRQAVAVEPRNAEAHREFARFLLRHRKEQAAVYHLRVAYRLDPTDRWVLDELVARGAVPALSPERAPPRGVGSSPTGSNPPASGG